MDPTTTREPGNGLLRALHREPTPNALTHPAETPASLLVLARAEKRLTGMVARGAEHGHVLAVFGMYEALYERATALAVPWSVPTPADLLTPNEADVLALPLAIVRVGGIPAGVA